MVAVMGSDFGRTNKGNADLGPARGLGEAYSGANRWKGQAA